MILLLYPMVKKLSSLTLFFPFYNDAGTVGRMISEAYKYAPKVSQQFEVIAIHGGSSKDETWREIMKAKQQFPDLRVLNRAKNIEGYAVIKHGFNAAKYEWIFYTDGDGQYNVEDIYKLVARQQQTGAEIINGYKLNRSDTTQRKVLGKVFEKWYRALIHLPLRDIHCDFRLIKASYVKKITWQTKGATIISELILKLKFQGANFSEVPVQHNARVWGHSNYIWYKLTWQSLLEILWSIKYTYFSDHLL